MSSVKELINSVLNRLRGALGTDEKPDGSNWNFIVDWYNEHVDRIGRGPWCEMTNTWAMWTGGVKPLKTGRAYTVWAAQDAQKGGNRSSWYWGTQGMRAGDQVYYDWSGSKGNVSRVDHTGTVEKILGDGTFYVLEGNTGNRLKRMRRDSKYVVGYVRFDWELLAPDSTVRPKPPKATRPKSTADREKTKRVQAALEVERDGYWGRKTDVRAVRMRTAARAKAGYPKAVEYDFNVTDVQRIIDTGIDGIWGPKSQTALIRWIKEFQHVLGVTADGQWGPRTDNAFLTARKNNLNNF